MAKIFLGEHEIKIGRRCYVLCPSFLALYTIEQESGLAIPELIGLLNDIGDVRLIRLVIEQGVQAANYDMSHRPKLSKQQLRTLHHDAIRFLVQGLGYLFDEAAPHNATILQDELPNSDKINLPDGAVDFESLTDLLSQPFESINWRELYKTATGLLGKSETEFWQMTMCGFMLQSESYIVSQGVEVAEVGLPASLAELHSLMEQFPDENMVLQ